jgi:hypothetical protein
MKLRSVGIDGSLDDLVIVNGKRIMFLAETLGTQHLRRHDQKRRIVPLLMAFYHFCTNTR